MKALFKHLSAITQGNPGKVVLAPSRPRRYHTLPSASNISVPFLSTTLLAALLGVPQVPIFGSGKAIAQTTASCPAGTAPETVQLRPSDNLSDLIQEYNIGGIRTILTITEEVPGQVIDRTESRVGTDIYGGIPGPSLRLNIGPGKPPETGNLSPGSAAFTLTFAQSVTLASPLTLLDVDRDGPRDSGRTFQDVVTVTASNETSNVPVNLQSLGSFNRISGNSALGIVDNSFPEQGEGNVSITPGGAIDQIRIQYQVGREFGQPGQDQTIGLAPFTICAPVPNAATIGDTVYRDTNGDSTQNPDEPGIPGINLTLTSPGADGQFGTPDDTTQNTTTDDNGRYSFPNLPAGNYRVIVNNPPDGLTPTQTPPQTIVLEAGNNFDTADFGYAPSAVGSIGDTVYTDANRNNVQDEGELGIEGATVTLTLPGPDGQFGTPDDTTQTTTTNTEGRYSFPNLPAGNYRVTATSPREGDTATQAQPDVVALQPGQNIDTVDFGFVPGQLGQGQSSIGDTVYTDTNRNNTQDAGETGISGVTVTLTLPGPDGEFGTPDDPTQTTTTNENGNYSFPNLPAGNYRVTITNPDGLTPTQTPPGTINLPANQNLDTIDFGLAPTQQGTGTIGDTVYRDINNNGQQDPGEPGIAGVIVNYAGTGPDGVFGDSLDDDDTSGLTRTDANGRYSFPDLPAGTYRVTINDQSQEPIRGLTPTQTPNGLINLNAGQNFEDADFGFTQPTGTIGDTVYRDNNSDGTQNQGEPGIPNVVVTLTRPGPDNQLGTPDDTTDTATTDNNGRYSFPNIPTGNYRVTVNNPPDDLSPTQTPPSTISLQPNQNFDTADFGFSPQQVGTIGDFVFYDNDGDRNPDLNEIGIPGITLVLRNTDGNEVARTTTGENGIYNFTVPPGTYTVTIENPPPGLNPTLQSTNPVTLQAGQNIDTVDFGFQPPTQGSIGDTVFADVNANRIQDQGEPGVSGVLVRLIRPGEDGVFGTSDDQIDEQRTDNTETLAFNQNTPGRYTFDNLPPGNYQVQMALPDGSILTTGANPISVNLLPNQNLDSADFGIRMTGLPGSIGDTVFNDTDGDGVQDQGEPGIPGVQLTLRDSEGRDFGTTTTNPNGNYTFDNLPLGTYTVESARPTDFNPTTQTTLSAELTQANPDTDEIDFGFRPGRLGASGPINLRLVKRITNVLRGNQPISGVAFNQFEDDGSDNDDNVLNSSPQSSPVGITRLETPVQSGDIVEYTIYFLSEGAESLQNVKFCDLIPNDTTFVDGSIIVNGGGSGADNGTFLSPLAPVPADFQNICRNGTPPNGAVLTNLGTLPAGGQFGFVRFRVRVD
ncbi:MAG: hypothetical protein HC874_04375 [Richelia sp. SL_2_1]|nr:hypothetical protein [Richelia sp. RM1_1_1]NJO26855.1 hypothetical protein [Richelia sp. SL_2_1]